jgi:predicted phosphodiesterase
VLFRSGHTHIWKLEKNFRNVLLVNPGSTSLPKGGNPPTFGFYESTPATANEHAHAKFSIHTLEDGMEIAAVSI